MREILFRGKAACGAWVQGDLIHRKIWQSEFEVIRVDDSGFDNYQEYEVATETIGQYTGLTDKNGKKIFEGDIVRTQPYSDRPYSKKQKFKSHIGIVRYEVRHFKNSLYEQDYEAKWNVYIKDYDGYFCYDWSPFFKCEVIGNIHDNPELLEVK